MTSAGIAAVLATPAVVLAALAAAGCHGAPAQVTHGTAPALVKLTGHRACEQLLADITRRGGPPGIPALRQVADRATAPRLAADARTAVRDIDHTGTAPPVALALLRDDCARAGVRIP